MTTMNRMWAVTLTLMTLAGAINIANWIFHASIVVFVLLGVQLLVLAEWIRLAVRQLRGQP